MKLNSRISILFVLMSAFLAHAWDLNWNYCDESWFLNRNFNSPWSASSEGIQVANPGCTEIQKDWELYDRMLDPSDGAPIGHYDDPDAAPPAPGILPGTKDGSHWFSLYNRKTGVLRTFLYIGVDLNTDGQKESMTLMVQNVSTNYNKHAYFQYDGPSYGYLLPDRANSSQEQPNYVMQYTKQHKWVITDTYLSYEPVNFASTYPGDYLYFDYQFKTYKSLQISLTGTATPDQPAGSENIFGSAVKLGTSTFNGFTEASKSVTGSVDQIDKVGDFLKNHGATSSGDLYKSLATSLAGKAAFLGSFLGGASIISSFLSTNLDNQISYPSYQIDLKGLITEVEQPENIKVPVAPSSLQQKNYYAAKYSVKEELALGLLGLNSAPTFNVVFVPKMGWYFMPTDYSLYYDAYINFNDVQSKIVVNPTSGAKIRSVSISYPNNGIPTNFVQTYSGSYGISAPPGVNMAGHWIDTKASNSNYAGRYMKGSSPEAVSYTRINATYPNPPIARPSVTSSIPVKLYIVLESSPGVYQEIVKTYYANVNKVIYEPIPYQNNPYGRNSTIVQGVLNSSDAANRTTVPIVDPIVSVIPTNVGQVSYAGRANWYVRQNGPSEIGNAPYAVSGYVGNNSSTSLKFTFSGSAFVWDWKVSSENYYDYLYLYVDGVQTNFLISGESGWSHNQYDCPSAGVHTVEFRYQKDGSIGRGEDRAYIANVLIGS